MNIFVQLADGMISLLADGNFTQVEKTCRLACHKCKTLAPMGGYEKVLAQKEEAIAQMQGDYHKITVADKGIGFEAQYADRIFEVFQRLHNKDEFEGTGIGLAICRKIIQNHKGYIAAYGKPGLGALFVIYLPVED